MLAGFPDHHGQFQLVIQFLGQMFRINNGLVRPDNRVNILEKHDPGQNGMRKSRLLCLLVMLAEISRRMEELFRQNWRAQLHIRQVVDQFFVRGA